MTDELKERVLTEEARKVLEAAMDLGAGLPGSIVRWRGTEECRLVPVERVDRLNAAVGDYLRSLEPRERYAVYESEGGFNIIGPGAFIGRAWIREHAERIASLLNAEEGK